MNESIPLEIKNIKDSFIQKDKIGIHIAMVLNKGRILMGREYFLNEIDFKKNDLIVDCGANIGDLQLYFQEKKIDFFLRYIGIEPSLQEFSCLQRNISQSSFMSKNNFQYGLWSENIKKEFFVSSEYADSSFIKPKLFSDTAIIDCQRLDEFLNEPIKLLKIEAEGGEPEVLIGCKKILDKIEYISADLGFERGLSQESTLVPVTNYLLSNNFELIAIGYPRLVALFKNKLN